MLAEGSVRRVAPHGLDQVAESVSASLRKHGLRVAGQLDVAARVRRSLGIALGPCRILFVLPGAGVTPEVAAFLPLHVVISESGSQCEILAPNRPQLQDDDPRAQLYAQVVEAQRQTVKAVDAVAARSSILL